MIEVHPPHENVHTWRQFFIHIAAVTIGLLIAIGLEQTVAARRANIVSGNRVEIGLRTG